MTALPAAPTRPLGPVVLHLVRHGESTWNAEGRLQGQIADVPLTRRGRGQARRAAVHLAGRGVDAVFTSDLLRAVQSAHEVGVATGQVPVPEPALREQALGDLQGRLTRELVAQPPPAGVHVSEVRWGGGESIADVHARLVAYFARLRVDPPGRRVALVSHGDTIRVALAVLRGASARDVDWVEVPNGSVTTVRVPAQEDDS